MTEKSKTVTHAGICTNLDCPSFGKDQKGLEVAPDGSTFCPKCGVGGVLVPSEWQQPGRYTSALAQALDTVGTECCDDEIGSVDEGGHHTLFRSVRAIMHTDSQGFVSADAYDTDAAVSEAWDELADEAANADADADITDQLDLPVADPEDADTHVVIASDGNEPVALVELEPGQEAEDAFWDWCRLEAEAICRGEKVDEKSTRERREILEGVISSHSYHALRSVKLPE